MISAIRHPLRRFFFFGSPGRGRRAERRDRRVLRRSPVPAHRSRAPAWLRVRPAAWRGSGCLRRRPMRAPGSERDPPHPRRRVVGRGTHRNGRRLSGCAVRSPGRCRAPLAGSGLTSGAARPRRGGAGVDGRDLSRGIGQILEQVAQAGIGVVPGGGAVAFRHRQGVLLVGRDGGTGRVSGALLHVDRLPAEAPRRRPDPQCYESSSEISLELRRAAWALTVLRRSSTSRTGTPLLV